MSEQTVKQLAETVGAPVERLLSQMRDAGLPHANEGDVVTDAEKKTLLDSLRKSRGGEADSKPKQITMKRKKTNTLKASPGRGGRSVNVEVRRKRTYVKKSEAEPQAPVEEELPTTPPEVEEEVVAEVQPTEPVEAEAPAPEVVPEPVPEPEPEPEPEPVAEAPPPEPEPAAPAAPMSALEQERARNREIENSRIAASERSKREEESRKESVARAREEKERARVAAEEADRKRKAAEAAQPKDRLPIRLRKFKPKRRPQRKVVVVVPAKTSLGAAVMIEAVHAEAAEVVASCLLKGISAVPSVELPLFM